MENVPYHGLSIPIAGLRRETADVIQLNINLL